MIVAVAGMKMGLSLGHAVHVTAPRGSSSAWLRPASPFSMCSAGKSTRIRRQLEHVQAASNKSFASLWI
ncbi:MAG: hypothetical protein DMG32_05880 [Acidobacteria bacterium]|nr:MAG: hypothetical protein DMG32_05880 [Acidobacteriota bacterium]